MPDVSLLIVWGYLEEGVKKQYIVTREAFALLNEPLMEPSVFISYKHDESCALGLLVVARLQMKGIENPFIDMDIPPGANWESDLQDRVSNADHLILLIGKETLKSEGVQNEIRWAVNSKSKIIPIWHNGFTSEYFEDHLAEYPEDIVEVVNVNQGILITDEKAIQYDTAIRLLLNSLGYAP